MLIPLALRFVLPPFCLLVILIGIARFVGVGLSTAIVHWTAGDTAYARDLDRVQQIARRTPFDLDRFVWYAPDQRYLAVITLDTPTNIWNLQVIDTYSGMSQCSAAVAEGTALDFTIEMRWLSNDRLVYTRSLDRHHDELYRLDADACIATPITALGQLIRFVAWSYDSVYVAFVAEDASGDDLYLLNLVTNDLQLVTAAQTGIFGVGWSPDQRYLGYQVPEHVYLYDMAAGRTSDWTNMTFTPNPRYVMRYTPINTFTHRAELLLWQDGRIGGQVWHEINLVGQPTWSPSGRYFTYVRLENADNALRVYVYDTEAQTTQTLLEGVYAFINVQWSPDEQHYALVSSAVNAGSFRVSVLNQTTDEEQLVNYAPLVATILGWSADQRHLLYSIRDQAWNETLYAFDLLQIGNRRITQLAGGSIPMIQSTPHSRYLRLSLNNDQCVEVLDTLTWNTIPLGCSEYFVFTAFLP
jgi:WD40 repeat protein